MQFTIQENNTQFKNTLKNVYSNSEIQQFLFLIYEKVLNLTKIQVLTNPDMLIEADNCKIILSIKERLLVNEPIQYILQETEFYDLKFKVSPAVLIPRPETEELVQWVIDDNDNVKGAKIIDFATGSGCIAISLAKSIANSEVYAVDISEPALKIAEFNSKQNSSDVNFFEFDILNGDINILPKSVDIIVSNPPYVKNSEKALMKPNVLNYEPDIALFVEDDDPLLFYNKIAKIGCEVLKNGGALYFEINEALAKEVTILLKELNYSEIEIRKDINGKDRMVKGVCSLRSY